MDKASFFRQNTTPDKGVEIFPETLGPELDIPNCGFTFATGTYLTGVTEIHSEGSRFGRPSYRLAPRRR